MNLFKMPVTPKYCTPLIVKHQFKAVNTPRGGTGGLTLW